MLSLWPQFVYGGLLVLNIGMSIGQHGQPKRGTHDATGSFIGVGIAVWLLYMGGFWTGAN